MATTLPFTLTFDLHGDGNTAMDNAEMLVKDANLCLSDDTVIIKENIESNVNGCHQVVYEVDGKLTALKLAAAYVGVTFDPYDAELHSIVRLALVA